MSASGLVSKIGLVPTVRSLNFHPVGMRLPLRQHKMTATLWVHHCAYGIIIVPVEETKMISLLRLKLAIRSTLILNELTRK